MEIIENKISLTLEEIDNYLIDRRSYSRKFKDRENNKNSDFQLVKFDLIDTVEHSMNLGHIYKVVFKYHGELFMNEIELDYGTDSDVFDDYIANDGNEDFDFFPAEEITVVDYKIKK